MKNKFKLVTIFSRGVALLGIVLCMASLGYSQDIELKVVPERKDAVYSVGEKVNFIVSLKQEGKPINNIKFTYEVGAEKMSPQSKGEGHIQKDSLKIGGYSMETPGFLRCTVSLNHEGKAYKAIGTAGISPELITATNELPKDFLEFWQKQISGSSKIPLDPKMTLLEDKSTNQVSVYHISFQNNQLGSRIYGILSIPKKEGKYPAVIRYPGAGIRAHAGNPALAAKGMITLEIGIHGIPVNLEPEIYENLFRGSLSGYPYFNLDSRDSYYFKRVILGCVKAIDFIYALPEFDGNNLAVAGSSQGGALSIITTALDKRVKYTLAFCPALSDLTGFLHNRAAGWPNMFNNSNKGLSATKDKIITTGYYDVANFARYVEVPGFYSLGFNDEVTPPTSIYAAYNLIKGPKKFLIIPEIGHVVNKEQTVEWLGWLESSLVKK